MKFSGKIGFWEESHEMAPGVWKPSIVEKSYTGDILRSRRNFTGSNDQNKTFTINNRISILADLYARENWPSIRYIYWKGIKWEVNSVEEDYPRLMLEIGGVWNENEGKSSESSGNNL